MSECCKHTNHTHLLNIKSSLNYDMTKDFKRMRKFIFITLSVWLLSFLAVNYQSIQELARFAISFYNYKYLSNDTIPRNSDYEVLYGLNNVQNSKFWAKYRKTPESSFDSIDMSSTVINHRRMLYIMRYLDSCGIKYSWALVPTNSYAVRFADYNILINPGKSNRFKLITAHYDILEQKGYQGALDNSGSVAILLNLIGKNLNVLRDKNVAVLFTTGEEKGLLGAKHFLKNNTDFKIEEVVCLDGIGRGRLGVMNISEGGFGFRYKNWLFKNKTFTGGEFKDCPKFKEIDKSVIDLEKYDIKVLSQYLSSTDARVFSEAGIPTVHFISDEIIHFLKVLHTNNDKVDGLHLKSLKQCEDILSAYIRE